MARTPADDLKDLFRGASSVDIEVGYFSIAGWCCIYEAIPEKARIRIIVGMFKDKESIKDNLYIESADIKALKNLASRIHRELCEIAKAENLHYKRYISKRFSRRIQIITGSGNLSQNALSGQQRNDWHPVRYRQTRENIVQSFENDWKISQNISNQTKEAIMDEIRKKCENWEPPKRKRFWVF